MQLFPVRSVTVSLFCAAGLTACDGPVETADAKDASRDFVSQQQASGKIKLPDNVSADTSAGKTYIYWQSAANLFGACADVEKAGGDKVRKDFVLDAVTQNIGKLPNRGVDADASAAISQLVGLKPKLDQITKNGRKPVPPSAPASQPPTDFELFKQSALRRAATFAAGQVEINKANKGLEDARDALYGRYGYTVRPIVIGQKSCITAPAFFDFKLQP